MQVAITTSCPCLYTLLQIQGFLKYIALEEFCVNQLLHLSCILCHGLENMAFAFWQLMQWRREVEEVAIFREASFS